MGTRNSFRRTNQDQGVPPAASHMLWSLCWNAVAYSAFGFVTSQCLEGLQPASRTCLPPLPPTRAPHCVLVKAACRDLRVVDSNGFGYGG